MFTIHDPLVFTFGILGNIISFAVFLAPLPTFIRVYRKKSTEGFQSLPYVVAIFSAMLWIYYALLKGNSVLLITINIAGVIIETIYVAIFITYAPRQARISTLKLLLLMNFGGFCSIVLLCHYLAKGQARLQLYGWICVAFSTIVFVAPLSVMRTVIRTKSVEYMPFNLSCCLTLTATVWFFYGFVQRDLYVTLPNVVGFVFGVAQMALYLIYSRKYKQEAEKQKLPEVVKQETVEIHTINNKSTDEDIIIPPHQLPREIEVVIETKDTTTTQEDDDDQVCTNGNVKVQQDSLNGPSQGPSKSDVDVDAEKIIGGCNVDVEKIVGGPGPAPAVQLVQCAV